MSHGVPATLRESVRTRGRILRLVPHAGAGPVSALLGCNLLLGLLPVGFIVATSVMLGSVPAAVAAGAGSAEWSATVVAFVVASAMFAGQQALAPVQTALGELVARRVDGHMYDRLIAASLRSTGIGPLEDPRLLDELSEASNELEQGFQSPGRACAGMLHLLARVVQLAGYVIAVAVAFSWWAAVGLLATVLVFRSGQRGGLRRFSTVVHTVAPQRRAFRYLRQLALHSSAAKEIRVFGLLDWLTDRYRRAYLAYLAPLWRRRRRIMLWPYFWFTAFGLAVTAVVLAAVAAAGADTLALTSLALTIQAVLGGLRLAEFYPEADVQTQFGMNAYEAVRRFEREVEGREESRDPPATAPHRRPPDGAAGDGDDVGGADAGTGGVRFAGVTFGYPHQDAPVLDQLDLAIPAGKCTAIVGANGAGKTTLVKLLTRLYEPDKGTISIDGVISASVPAERWRAQLGVIFQDFNRYEASAADNIGFGAVDHLADRDGIRQAAADAGILDTLDRLPAGLDTPLSRHLPGGTDLSGGQWQRVALARALFRLRHGARVLVLDEPTASLDVRAEASFFDEFVRVTRGSTTILISHRFSTVRHADRIVVLGDGRVVEAGSHDELLAADGTYARLFRLQADRFAGDAQDQPPAADQVVER